MFDHFNFLAPIYDRVIKPKPPERLTELVNINPAGNILDVGGGTGRISQFFSGQAEQIVVADLSFQMLGKSQLKNGLCPINSHSEKLPFQAQTAQELWRVIKPGGRIVIEEPDIHTRGVKLIALAEKLALMRSHFLSGQEIRDLFSGLPGSIEILTEDHFVWVVIEKGQG